MKEFFYYFIFAVIFYYILVAIFDNFKLEQENFDPSLVPVSSVVTFAKIANKLLDNRTGILTIPNNLTVGNNFTVNGNVTSNDLVVKNGLTTNSIRSTNVNINNLNINNNAVVRINQKLFSTREIVIDSLKFDLFSQIKFSRLNNKWNKLFNNNLSIIDVSLSYYSDPTSRSREIIDYYEINKLNQEINNNGKITSYKTAIAYTFDATKRPQISPIYGSLIPAQLNTWGRCFQIIRYYCSPFDPNIKIITTDLGSNSSPRNNGTGIDINFNC